MKKRNIIVSMILMVIISLIFIQLYRKNNNKQPPYVNALFDDSYVHKIEITMDEKDWIQLKEKAIDKPAYQVTVTIDGLTVEDVHFSPKGSSSLRNVVQYEFYKDRYSYKLIFDKYNEEQTYLGLDELLLNNSINDPSCARDVIAYDLFEKVAVACPLTSYTELYVNGKLEGLYVAVESNTKSFLKRTLGDGAFYMPEAQVITQANKDAKKEIKQYIKENGKSTEIPIIKYLPLDNLYDTAGADLKYTDDHFESYIDIFDNAETVITDQDKEELIQALKLISQGNVEEALDVEEVISYFAVHNFITNWDSYSWKMLHNYGIYESDGKLSMIPWDYNLAFDVLVPAVMDAENNRESVINMDIDNPGFKGVSGKNRPMWSWIVNEEKYKQQYHNVISKKILSYFESGQFEKDMQKRHDMIYPYLQKDPTYNYTMEEFEQGYQELIDFCLDRAESVRKQINK